MLKVMAFMLISFLCGSLLAQPQLVLLKKDRVITRFEEGEYIRFQRKDDGGFIRALIVGIHSGYFIVSTDTIYTYNIARIDLRKKVTTNIKGASIGKGLITAGVALALIDLFNTVVIRDEPFGIDNRVAGVSVGLIGVGGLMQLVNNNFFKIGRHKKVATLNLRAAAPN